MSESKLPKRRLIIPGESALRMPPSSFYVTEEAHDYGGRKRKCVRVEVCEHDSLAQFTLLFVGYRFVEGRTYYGRRIKPRVSRESEPRWVIVEFPAQHMAERILSEQDPATLPVDARLSDPSRLVFGVPKRVGWDHVELEFSRLVDWRRLDLQVSKRASQRIGQGLQYQREHAFGEDLGANLSLTKATPLLQAMLEPPEALETSLELTNRLLFSPSERAQWVSTSTRLRPLPEGGVTVSMWSVALAPTGDESLRALWSRQLVERQFPSAEALKVRDPQLALSLQNHWEIIGQTSVFALPALRRIESTTQQPADGIHAPTGQVIRPDEDVVYLCETDKIMGYTNRDSGLALAVPFRSARMRLTSLGASMQLEWKGEPAGLRPDSAAWKGYSLERLFYETWLGRDCHVVAVEKGYLFPLGIRASRITVHERKVREVDGHGPASFEQCRQLIVTPNRRRPFPGPYHPYEAREFPVGGIRMKSTITPSLVPNEIFANKPGYSWVRVAARTGDDVGQNFQFEWSTDDVESIKSALIWVKNDVLADSEMMERLCHYYNALGPEREAALFGARHSYARPNEPTDDKPTPAETSFDTDVWQLAATGRIDVGVGHRNEHRMDGRMEGADQPPFYPRLESAVVGIQSVDRLLHVPQGRYRVNFDHDYLKRESEDVYLRLIGTGAVLDTLHRPRATGGVAAPKVHIGGMAKSIGPVGGRPLSKALDGDDHRWLVDISRAKEGYFDPRQFFGELKLLGVLDLRDVLSSCKIDRAPKLVETLTMGISPAALESIKTAARNCKERLARNRTFERLRTWFDADIEALKRSIRELYPRLVEVLEKVLRTIESSLDNILLATNSSQLLLIAQSLHREVKPALRQIDLVLRDPVPDLLRDELARFIRVHLDSLKGLQDWSTRLSSAAATHLSTWGSRELDALVSDYAAALTGRPITATDLVNPAAAWRAVNDALLGAPMAQQLADLLVGYQWLWDPRSVLGELFPDRRQLIDRAVGAALGAIEFAQEPADPTDARDLRHADRRGTLVNELTLALHSLALQGPPERSAINEWIKKLPDDVSVYVLQTAPQIVQSHLDGLRPKANVDKADILGAITRTISETIEAKELVALVDRAKRWQALLQHRIDAFEKHGLKTLVDTIAELIESALAVLSFREIAERRGWCARGQAFAEAISTAVLSLDPAVTRALETIRDAALHLRDEVAFPPSLADVVHALSGEAQNLLSEWERLDPSAPDLCARPVEAARILQTYADFSAQATRASSRMARSLARTKHELPASLQHYVPTIFQRMVVLASALGPARPLTDFASLLDDAVSAAGTALRPEHDELAREIEVLVRGIKQEAAVLKQELSRPDFDIESLVTASDELEALASRAHRELAARLFQSVVASPDTVKSLEGIVSNSLTAIGALGQATLVPLYGMLIDLIRRIEDIGEIILDYVLHLTPAELQGLETQLQEECDLIESLSLATNLPDKIEIAKEIQTRLETGKSALHAFVGLVEGLRSIDLAQNLLGAVSNLLESFAEDLRALLTQIVPTKVETSFQWATGIRGDLPPSFPVFSMMDQSATDALVLQGHYSYDIVSGASESTVRGKLRRFKLSLLPQMRMADVTFKGATFESRMGGSPNFDVEIESVEIGAVMEFLKALQEWFVPQGSGLFLRPTPHPRGIEVGYEYGAGLIQVGTLQFINVHFFVSACLFFNGADAKFNLKLGTLVASPPYGGGGELALVCTPKGDIDATLTIVFGGVAALKFGPLEATGRVLAGMRLRKSSKGWTFTILFEAVGEASIACFSLSVCIRITLEQQAGGDMYGGAWYSFKFKVGFASISYSVHAQYRLRGKSGTALDLLSAQVATPYTRRNGLPSKAHQWRAYRELYDLELTRKP